MKSRQFIPLTLCVLVANLAFAAQDAAPQAAAPAPTAEIFNTHDKAKIFVYRYKQFVGSALEPSVYCDDNQLARMDNGRFFIVELPAGVHEFRSNDKQSGVELDLKSGETYYLRVELATGFWKGHGRLVKTEAEQGAYEVKQLKFLDPDKIKDKKLVVSPGRLAEER